MKFGGTSVQDAGAITKLVEIVRSRQGARLVVVSALSKVTDGLLEIANLCEHGHLTAAQGKVLALHERHREVGRELGLTPASLAPLDAQFDELKNLVVALANLKEVSLRSRDRLASFGELCSSLLVNGAFLHAKMNCAWLDSRQFVRTNSDFTSAAVDFGETYTRIASEVGPRLEAAGVAVAQGFVGSDPAGNTTTLGRGGSDYSGAIYGAGLGAERVEIWTDVDGILTTDPRMVPTAKPIRHIHFLEAAELAYFGAKVLHPATIYPAVDKKIPVWILNSKNPTDPGTQISFDSDSQTVGIRGIAAKKNVTLINIYSTRMLGAHGFLKSVFDIFARHRLSIDLISTSEVNVSVTLDPTSKEEVIAAATKDLAEISEVEVRKDQAIVSLVGNGIRRTPGLAGRIFSEISDINVHMISMGASELNLSFVIEGQHLASAVTRLHAGLIDS